MLTQILHVLIRQQSEVSALLTLRRSRLGSETFVDNDSISHTCCNERSAITELRPARVEVECQVREAIT